MQPRSVLAVAAHPYAVELHAGATLAALARADVEVRIVVCTDGVRGVNAEAGLAELRRHEAERAGHVLGAKETIFLDFEDGVLAADEPLRCALVREIRRNRPELVLAPDPTNLWRRQGDRVLLGHSDRRACGLAVLDAIEPRAPNRSFYPDLDLAPWLVRELWLYDTAEPDHFVETEMGADAKRAALECHVSQIPRRLVEEAEEDAESFRERRGFAAEAFRRLWLV